MKFMENFCLYKSFCSLDKNCQTWGITIDRNTESYIFRMLNLDLGDGLQSIFQKNDV